MSSYVPMHLRRLVAERAQGLCEYCLIHQDDTFLGCQIEHVISEKHGGKTVEGNLAMACVFCNRFKGTDIATMSRNNGHLVRLFNPRSDLWAEHFQLEGSRIVGISEVGAATAALLGFNQSDRILERKELIASGRYPSVSARHRMQRI
ncbi:MAG: HNH endonuclease [Phycisphaerales bacterium]|nr:HNH endonuclease [Phycisphaerales bacterium]